MSYCYVLISRNNIPLCQHLVINGNFDLYVQKFLPKDNLKEGLTMIKSDDYIWAIKNEQNGLNILCVVKNDFDTSILIKILDEIRNRFLRNFGNEWKKATHYSLQSSFEPHLIDISKTIVSKNNYGITPPSLVNIDESNINLLENQNEPFIQINSQKKKNNNFKFLFLLIFFLILIILLLYYLN